MDSSLKEVLCWDCSSGTSPTPSDLDDPDFWPGQPEAPGIPAGQNPNRDLLPDFFSELREPPTFVELPRQRLRRDEE